MFKWEWTWVTYDWFMLMFGRIQYNTVKQLSFDYKFYKGIWLLSRGGIEDTVSWEPIILQSNDRIRLTWRWAEMDNFSFGEQKSMGFSDGLWRSEERSVLEMTSKFCLSRFVMPLTEMWTRLGIEIRVSFCPNWFEMPTKLPNGGFEWDRKGWNSK